MHDDMICNGHYPTQTRYCPNDSVGITHGPGLASDEGHGGLRHAGEVGHVPNSNTRADLSGSVHLCGDAQGD
jgi:hypothetical protein